MRAQLGHEPQELVERYARRVGLESLYATLDSYNLRSEGRCRSDTPSLSCLLRQHIKSRRKKKKKPRGDFYTY